MFKKGNSKLARMKNRLLPILIFSVLIFSCTDQQGKKNNRILPKSVGNINALQVVIQDSLWQGEVGEAIRSYFAAPTDGLPQDEPLFDLRQYKPEAFSGFARTNRIFLKVGLAKKDSVSIVKNPFAIPQTGGFVYAKTAEGLINLFSKNHQKLIEAFHTTEIKERQKRTSISTLRLDSLKQWFGITLKVPSAYKIAKKTPGFYWVRKHLKSGSTNILVYEVPLATITNDSLAMSEIIKIRDSIGGRELPVEDDGRFITEKAYAPFIFKTRIAGFEAYETKGTWEVEGELMAGPFLNYAIKDTLNNRYLILEGFTYAPSVDKRNLQFELESILKSVKINKRK